MSEGSPDEANWLDLADAIALLREQVSQAQYQVAAMSEDAGVLFGLGEITMEFGMELTRATGQDAGLRFSVVSFGGSREKTRQATHTVTVKLNPHLAGGGDVDVSDVD